MKLTDLVLDASAALELARDQQSPVPEFGRCIAPAIIDLELLSSLRKLVRLEQMGAMKAAEVVSRWMTNELKRVHHLLLLPRVWELRSNITAYDAAYVALAESLDLPLLTSDLRLARAASAYCEVITVGG